MSPQAERFKSIHWNIYVNYYKAKSYLETFELLRDPKFAGRFPEFSVTTFEAFVRQGLLCLAKIFDNHPKSDTIGKLLNYSLCNKEIALAIEQDFSGCKFLKQETHDAIRCDMVTLEGYVSIIKNWRNKGIAHEDPHFMTVSPIETICWRSILTFLEKYILDYGSTPNHIFEKPDRYVIERIKEEFARI